MKTRNHIYHFVKVNSFWFLLLSGIASCGEQLETSPLTGLEQSNVWTDEAGATTALMGCYRGNIVYNTTGFETDWNSYGGLLFMEFASDNALDRRATTTGNSNYHKLSDGTLNASNNTINAYWKNAYAKIARCNRFIENIDRINASSAVIDRMKAEARFLRAVQYFYLSQYFGAVPLVRQTLTPENANTVKKNAKTEVVDFVISELTETAGILPRQKDLSASETGRATAQAALAFLGRILLADRQWAQAAIACKKIIDWGDNLIDPDYQSIFLPSNENSAENIFAVQYLENLAGNALPQHAYPAVANGWHIICPMGSLWEAYEFDSGHPFSFDSARYDPTDLGKNRDPRLRYTLLYDRSDFKGKKYICHPDASSSLDQLGAGKQTTYTGFGLRKFFDEGYSGSLYLYGANVIVVRYAEVLLNYLEARLEGGSVITQELLDSTINKIRGRASVQMPPVQEVNPALLRPVMRNERRVELAMEGHRYWDILRWGIAHEVLNGDCYGAPFPGAGNMRKKNGQNDPHDRWFVITRNFRNPQDYQWPIPQSQQDINPNLREN
ncbi:MAG: RagB/SusD family nutrient uptake outer membrane protein [Bacteroidales bacterium]|jgi:hypothetical protein|nr:RagB/SusD family nutrient uptake outer membrane protein [Bacteroidales bacterium]